MKYAILVLRNLFRNKRRTLLTIFSIAVSLFVFSALVSLPTVANQVLAMSASSFRVACHNKAGLTYPLPEAYKRKIQGVRHVQNVAAFSWFGGIYDDPNDQFPNFAVDHEDLDQIWPDWDISPESMVLMKKSRTSCLIGRGLAQKYNWHVGQQIVLKGTIYPINITFQIAGILGGKSPPTFFLFRRDYLDEAVGRPGFVGNYWIRVDSAQAIPGVIAEIDETFANSEAETQTESEASFFGSFLSSYRTIFRVAEALGIIVVITIGLVAANTAAMSIRERRGEIAVLRSIGFSQRIILACLLSECLIIGIIGGLLGCLTAFVVLRIVTVSAAALGPMGIIRMPPIVVAESLVIAALIGFMSGLVPATAAARLKIVDSLRLAV